MDKETGLLRLDRVLYTSTHYPANYGFIPRTYANDGDPLDVLVLCSENIIPMSLVRCYPIGVIIMDDGGSEDEKIIAIPFDDPPTTTTRTSPSCPSISSPRCSTSSRCTSSWRMPLTLRSARCGTMRRPRPSSPPAWSGT